MHARISYLYILSYAYLFLVFHPLSHPVCGRNRFPGHKRSIVKDRHIGQSQLRYHLFDLILRQIFSGLFFHHVKKEYPMKIQEMKQQLQTPHTIFCEPIRIWERISFCSAWAALMHTAQTQKTLIWMCAGLCRKQQTRNPDRS